MALEETHSTLPCLSLTPPPPRRPHPPPSLPSNFPASFKILSFAPGPRMRAVAQYVAMDKL